MDLSSRQRAILIFSDLHCKLVGDIDELRRFAHKVRHTNNDNILSFIINVARPGFDYAPYRVKFSAITQPFVAIGEQLTTEYQFFEPVATPEDQQSRVCRALLQQQFREVVESNDLTMDHYNF